LVLMVFIWALDIYPKKKSRPPGRDFSTLFPLELTTAPYTFKM